MSADRTPRRLKQNVGNRVHGARLTFGDRRLTEAFWANVSPCPSSGCWLWTGREYNGYGRFGPRTAHNLALRSVIPHWGDLEVDHLCSMRCCVNPDHLEWVTQAENRERTFERRHGWRSQSLTPLPARKD